VPIQPLVPIIIVLIIILFSFRFHATIDHDKHDSSSEMKTLEAAAGSASNNSFRIVNQFARKKKREGKVTNRRIIMRVTVQEFSFHNDGKKEHNGIQVRDEEGVVRWNVVVCQ
jgi:hypothetical protein